MDFIVQIIAGVILSPLYQLLKNRFGWANAGALFGVFCVTFIVSVPLTFVSGALTGITFDFADPIAFFDAVGRAFGIVFASATATYNIWKYTRRSHPPDGDSSVSTGHDLGK